MTKTLTTILRPPRATIVDVAKSAGVHFSTASRALNPDTRHLISDDVARKIDAAAEKLGYRRNSMASGLRTQKSGTIGVVITNLSDPLHPPMVSAIEVRLMAVGYVTFVAGTDYKRDKLVALIDRMIARSVDGLIVSSFDLNDPAVDACMAAGIPTVAVLRDPTDRRISSVISDDVAGLDLVVTHLTDLGHRRILHIAGPQNASTGRNRLRGFQKAMKAALGSQAELSVVEARAYAISEGERIMTAVLSGPVMPTAIVAGNDMLAVGCLKAMRAAGLKCPDDMSLVGINDMPFMDMITPPLTSLRTSGGDLGAEGAELLIKTMRDPKQQVRHLVLQPELVVRASTARVPSETSKRRRAH